MPTLDGFIFTFLISNFELFDNKKSIATFTVPNESISIYIQLDCEINNISNNSKQKLTKNQIFEINGIDRSLKISQFFFVYSSYRTNSKRHSHTSQKHFHTLNVNSCINSYFGHAFWQLIVQKT